MIVDDTRKLLNKYRLFANKKFGQNFLINKGVLESIVNLSKVDKNTAVIEIGPGLGTLTEYLAIASGHVLTYEIDAQMIEVLNETLAAYTNITILHKDILEANIKDDIQAHLANYEKVVVVANLPYYITTPIILKFLEETEIEEFLFMVQKEVGQRFSGKPSTKDYNALSVLVKYKGDAKIVYKVPKNSFHPEPNVESVLLCLKAVKVDYGINNEANFFKFIRIMFSQRRKTLVNNLNGKVNKTKEEVKIVLEDLGINENIRSEALDLKTIIDIYKRLYE